MESKQSELTKIKSELSICQRQLADKEKAQSECEKNIEEANKAVNTALELKRELQLVKVVINYLKLC